MNTLYTGPLAHALGGVDLALPIGIIVASSVYAIVYAILMRRSCDGLRVPRRG